MPTAPLTDAVVNMLRGTDAGNNSERVKPGGTVCSAGLSRWGSTAGDGGRRIGMVKTVCRAFIVPEYDHLF